MEVDEIIEDVVKELEFAEGKHPEWPDGITHQVAIMVEEAGESHRAALQAVYEGGLKDHMYKKVIKTAAMCFRILKNKGE